MLTNNMAPFMGRVAEATPGYADVETEAMAIQVLPNDVESCRRQLLQLLVAAETRAMGGTAGLPVQAMTMAAVIGALGVASGLAVGIKVTMAIKRRAGAVGDALYRVMVGELARYLSDPRVEHRELHGRVAGVLALVAGFRGDVGELVGEIETLCLEAAEAASFIVEVAESLDGWAEGSGDSVIAGTWIDGMVDRLGDIAVAIGDIDRRLGAIGVATALIDAVAGQAGASVASASVGGEDIAVSRPFVLIAEEGAALARVASWPGDLLGKLNGMQAGLVALVTHLSAVRSVAAEDWAAFQH